MEPINKNLLYVDLYLYYDLKTIPNYSLPDGFHYVNFKKGDEKVWAEIETSAGEFDSIEDALNKFHQSFHNEDMSNMCFFIENDKNQRVATATAYYTNMGDITGKVHWIAIDKDYQGYKLSKPLISHVLKRLKELGHTKTILHTQTYSWLATKIYLDMGFIPYHLEEKYKGWQIIKYLTHHPVLNDIEDIDEKDVYKQETT